MQHWPIVSFLLARGDSVASACVRALNNVFVFHSALCKTFSLNVSANLNFLMLLAIAAL
jgi:hypothetical protein